MAECTVYELCIVPPLFLGGFLGFWLYRERIAVGNDRQKLLLVVPVYTHASDDCIYSIGWIGQ